jgi:LemA protein
MTGWIVLFFFVLTLAALGAYIVMIYNGFVQMRNDADKSWSNIDVLLKQRFDELPKLIKVCEGYMQHERKTLEAVIQARSQVSSARGEKEKLQAQNFLTETLRSLFAVTENYPELKADALFRQLGTRISQLEDQIADRRELFNDTVNRYNIRLEQFPDLFIARAFNFSGRSLWRIDPAHRQDVQVSFQH